MSENRQKKSKLENKLPIAEFKNAVAYKSLYLTSFCPFMSFCHENNCYGKLMGMSFEKWWEMGIPMIIPWEWESKFSSHGKPAKNTISLLFITNGMTFNPFHGACSFRIIFWFFVQCAAKIPMYYIVH